MLRSSLAGSNPADYKRRTCNIDINMIIRNILRISMFLFTLVNKKQHSTEILFRGSGNGVLTL